LFREVITGFVLIDDIKRVMNMILKEKYKIKDTIEKEDEHQILFV
jgi:hypothetical protein